MSAFNPETFLDTTHKESNATTLIPVPEGVWAAHVVKIDVRQLISEGEPPRVVVDLGWEIEEDAVKKATGMDRPIAVQTLWIDTTPEGGLDMGTGKNVGLGRLREALGQNKAGKPWSFNHLREARAMVEVIHASSKKDDTIYARVKRIAQKG